ncbi:thiolase family protein [Jatrophihabitans sp. DSM 45814]
MSNYSDAAVAGVYQTQQGDLSDRPQPEVWWECVLQACDDAGIPAGEIDGMIGPAAEGVGIRASLPGAVMGDLLGHPLRFHATSTIGAAAQSAGINLAAYAISQGLAEVVVIATAAAGVAAGYASSDRDSAVAAMAKLSGQYEYPYGGTRVSDYAALTRRHMYEYGTTAEQLAEVAVAQRRSATLHPLSYQGHRGEITIDDVLNSRMIADPLRMLDCCAINQGGGAMIIARTERVRRIGKHAPISLLGYGEGHMFLDPNALPDLTSFGGKIAAETAFGMAGVSPADIQVAAISDHFTSGVLFGLEDAGFCKAGEGGAFVSGGALNIGGRLPTNTSGGFLSFSHAGSCGLFGMIEVVEQLRHEAGGSRQVEGAELAYVSGVGGMMQCSYAAVLARV